MFNPQQKPGDELRTIKWIHLLPNKFVNQPTKADFDPAINVIFLLWFIDTPNNPTNDDTTARDLAWVAQHPLHVWRHRCEMDSSLLGPFSICRASPNWVHPRFICDLSTSPQAQNVSPSPAMMAWHGIKCSKFFSKVSSWWEWESKSEERRANEPPINCEVVSILKKQAGRPFVIPCASWCEQKCVKIHRAIQVRVKCANFHSKKPLIRKVCDSRKKRPIQLSQNPFHGTLSHFKSCSRMWFPLNALKALHSKSAKSNEKLVNVKRPFGAAFLKNQCQKPQSAGRRSKVKK